MMGNREDFEKWARDQGISLLPAPFQIGTFSNQVTEMAFRAWQARQPEIDALIHDNGNMLKAVTEYEKENAELKDERDAHRDNAQKLVELNGKIIAENAALKAEVERLRIRTENANGGLRKAAEDAADLLQILDSSDEFDRNDGAAILHNLRAELNKDKSC